MCQKLFVAVSIIVALVIAILGLFQQPGVQAFVAYATHFFVGLLPVLGVAGLIKYIGCCAKKGCGCGCTCACCKDGKCCKENGGSCSTK